MKIVEITYSMGRPLNLGNFQNVKVDISVTARVDEAEEAESVYTRLRDSVTSKVAAEAVKHGAR